MERHQPPSCGILGKRPSGGARSSKRGWPRSRPSSTRNSGASPTGSTPCWSKRSWPVCSPAGPRLSAICVSPISPQYLGGPPVAPPTAANHGPVFKIGGGTKVPRRVRFSSASAKAPAYEHRARRSRGGCTSGIPRRISSTTLSRRFLGIPFPDRLGIVRPSDSRTPQGWSDLPARLALERFGRIRLRAPLEMEVLCALLVGERAGDPVAGQFHELIDW